MESELHAWAKSKGACSEALSKIANINTGEQMARFVRKYGGWIADEINLRTPPTSDDLSVDEIEMWCKSPFISDYDKNRIRNLLNL
jgi:hypothetical protein